MIVEWMKEKKSILTDLAYHQPGDDIMARRTPAGTAAGPPRVAGAEREEQPLGAGAWARDCPIRNRSVTRHFSQRLCDFVWLPAACRAASTRTLIKLQ